jgi:ABC-2 type transport system ATP-binding protein
VIPAPVVELDGLTVRFGQRDILTDLRASLHGRAIGLLGPNGAGKTTLLHTLLGFHAPARGTARVLGMDVVADCQRVREELGYMPETDAFVGRMTAVRFVRLMAELSGLPHVAALERAHEALFLVGLGEARYRTLDSYSQGMRQKVKLAQAVAHGARLLLLDEPTNGLDPPAREKMLELIRQVRDAGDVRILLSSHLLHDVEAVCDEVLILKDGQVAGQSDLAAERHAERRFLDLELGGSAEGFLLATERLGCTSAPGRRGRIKLVIPDGVGVRQLYLAAAATGVEIRSLQARRDSLEDLFFHAMEGSSPTPRSAAREGAAGGGTADAEEVGHGGL